MNKNEFLEKLLYFITEITSIKSKDVIGIECSLDTIYIQTKLKKYSMCISEEEEINGDNPINIIYDE